MEQMFTAIGEIFLEKFPLFQRRLAWFQFDMDTDMSLKQAYYHLESKYDGARMDEMGKDEWHMFQLTYLSRKKPQLHHEILKIEDPTLAKVLATATAWETAQRTREQTSPKTMTYGVESMDGEAPILAIPEGNCNNCGLLHDLSLIHI